MLVRALAFGIGVLCALGLSQVPAFTQNYMQRLGGAVDELSGFVTAFDADARAVGLTRDAALQDLSQGGAMAAQRAITARATLERHARLSTALVTLQTSDPVSRMIRMPQHLDPEIARRTADSFRPAVPLGWDGLILSALGFFGGRGLTLMMIGGPLAIWQRHRDRKRVQQFS